VYTCNWVDRILSRGSVEFAADVDSLSTAAVTTFAKHVAGVDHTFPVGGVH